MELIQYILLELFLTAISYLLAPTIIILFYKKRKLSNKKIKKIAIINGVLVWLFIMIVRIESGDESTNYSVFLWTWISYLLMKHFCLEDESQPVYQAPTKQVNYANSVNSNSNQSSKRMDWDKLLYILYRVITILSLVLNLVLIVNNYNYSKTIEELEGANNSSRSQSMEWQEKYNDVKNELTELKAEYRTLKDKVDFYDVAVVFVEEDGTRYYHKYECDKFIGDSFWAYNVEYAEYRGYKPCPECYE